MKKAKLLKRTVSLTLTSAMIASAIVAGVKDSMVKASEKEENYIIQVSSESALENTLKVCNEIETTIDVIKNKLEDENIATVSLTKREAEELKERKSIVTIEKDKRVRGAKAKKVKKIKCKEIDLEWNKKLIKCEKRKSGDTTKRVKVAVIDSGVDWGNDIDLEETVSLVPGEEEMNPLFMDGTGHGNSVAGLIAAKDNDEGITGINPNAAIYSIRVLDDNNEAPLSRVIDGIYYAISKKVDIINMSFGLDSYSVALKNAIDAAEKAGILVVAAAGNTGDNVQYPAAYENVLSVGSVDSGTELADTSARGDRIDVVAPGELVCSTGQFGDLLIESGTSLAAPQVAAVASKIMEENPKASSEEVKNAIVNGANYNSEDEYGLLDETYTIENYEELKESDIEKGNNNDTSIEIGADTGCVKGSWSIGSHEYLVGSNHSDVKKGARFPDYNNKFKGLSDNPKWHGGYKCNYVAAYVYATRMANKLGKSENVASAKRISGIDEQSMLNDIASIKNWKKVKIGNDTYNLDTPGKRRAFVWGLAVHSLADIFAHSAFVKSNNKWCHLAHGKDSYGNPINDYADNTCKYKERFQAAENCVSRSIAKYDKKQEADYTELKGMSTVEKTFRLKDLVPKIMVAYPKANTKGLGSYNIENGPFDYWWKGEY